MFLSVLNRLSCPVPDCHGPLECLGDSAGLGDLMYGRLHCTRGAHCFPVLNGVAILVPDAAAYVRRNAAVIRRFVDRGRVDPETWRLIDSAPHAKEPAWSIDSEFATSLYVANQYLRNGREAQLEAHTFSRVVADLLRRHWNDNPLSYLEGSFRNCGVRGETLLDLGCNVGGAINSLGRFAEYSLGIDISFAAIVQARRLLNQSPIKIALPADRLLGLVSREVEVAWEGPVPGKAEFVVGDVFSAPVARESWSVVLALSVVDIVTDPLAFIRRHVELAAPGGYVVHGSPYLWFEAGANAVRAAVPPSLRTSSDAVEWLYVREGIELIDHRDDVPWIFFKFDRRAELNAVHLFLGRKS